MPEPRWFHAAAVGSDGKIYAYGGYVSNAQGPRQYGIGESSLVIYDPRADVWTRGPEAPKYRMRSRQRHSRSFRGEDGKIHRESYEKERIAEQRPVHELIAGVAGPLGRPHWLNYHSWIWFDVEKGRWEHPALLPVWVDNPDYDRENSPVGPRIVAEAAPRYFRYTGTLATGPSSRLYVTGGSGRPIDHPLERAKMLDVLEAYDAETSEWRLLAPMRVPRSLHTAAVDRKGRLFVFGGHQASPVTARGEGESQASFDRRSAENAHNANQSLTSVEMYDPATDTWMDRASMPTPRQAMGAALGADGRIYVVGGAKSYSDPVPLNVVEIYDPKRDTWNEGPPLKRPRRGHQVVALPDGRLYAIGGWVAPGNRRWPLGSPQVGRALGDTVEMLDTAAPSRR
jgi:N-acetylneuraminic acid mutarotase